MFTTTMHPVWCHTMENTFVHHFVKTTWLFWIIPVKIETIYYED